MKLTKLKEQEIRFLDATGQLRSLTFMQYVASAYRASPAYAGRQLTQNKFLLLHQQKLREGWEQLKTTAADQTVVVAQEIGRVQRLRKSLAGRLWLRITMGLKK